MNNRAGKETRCLLESISFGVINAWIKHINCTDFFSFFFLLFFRLKSLWSDKTVFRMTLSATVAGKFVRCQISAVHHLRIWLLCDCVSNKFITVLTLIKRLNYIRIQFYRMRGTLDPRPPNENVFLGNVNQKEKKCVQFVCTVVSSKNKRPFEMCICGPHKSTAWHPHDNWWSPLRANMMKAPYSGIELEMCRACVSRIIRRMEHV